MPDYGNDIYEPETGVVLEPIRPPVDEPVYYDEEEYVFQDYNDIPLTPPTPEPTQRHVSELISLLPEIYLHFMILSKVYLTH